LSKSSFKIRYDFKFCSGINKKNGDFLSPFFVLKIHQKYVVFVQLPFASPLSQSAWGLQRHKNLSGVVFVQI